MIYNNIIETIGKTPVIKLNNLGLDESYADIYVKLESFNPGGSVKDRAAYFMIKDLEEKNIIKKGDFIVEATSGNTGIGLAMVASSLGYNAIFVMPETMSEERRKLMKAYGAEIILTEGSKGMKGSIEKANELAQKDNHFMISQFTNFSNPKAHEITTANEIMSDFESLDAFISAVGTGGTITGTAKRFKEMNYDTKVIAVEPKDSPVLSGGSPSPHKIQGIGAGFIPKILDLSLVDEIVTVSNEEAFSNSRLMATKEGILVGISSGAALSAAIRVAKELGKGKKILFISADNGERYLSTELYK